MFENPDIGEERVQALNIPPDPRMLSGGPGGEGERGGAHVVAVGAAGIRAAPTQSLRPLDVDLDLPTRLEVHPRKVCPCLTQRTCGSVFVKRCNASFALPPIVTPPFSHSSLFCAGWNSWT